MNGKTEAIILGWQKHGDNSILVHAYTQECGRLSCLAFGNRWKSALTPMSLVEMVHSDNPTRPLPSISSVERLFVPHKQDVTHHCIYLFMAEALEKSLKMPLADENLFCWLKETLKKLDQTDELNDFPPYFLTQLSTLLGYGGAVLDEWHGLKSLDVVQTILA